MTMTWGRQINFDHFQLEKRVSKILEYISEHYCQTECGVADVDATGFMGNKLTQELNDVKMKSISLPELINIFNEDGQVFDMKLEIASGRIIFFLEIIRGDIVEIFGNADLIPESVLGNSENLDLKNYFF